MCNQRGSRFFAVAIVFTAALLVCAGTSHGQSRLQERIAPFLEQHCVGCHSGDAPDGGLDLQAISKDSGDLFKDLGDAEVLRRWVYLHDRVAAGEMPPKSESRPSAVSKSQFLTTLGESLSQADLSSREVTLRRLNRNEYENTVRDLFGIYVDLKRLLPDDSTEQGFDTTGSALSLSSQHMVLYVEAADLVLDRVFGPPKKPMAIKKTVNFATSSRGTDSSERKLSDGVVLFSGAKFLPMQVPTNVRRTHTDPWPVSGTHEDPGRTKRRTDCDAGCRRNNRIDRAAHGGILRSEAGSGDDHRIHRPQPRTVGLLLIRTRWRLSMVDGRRKGI